MSDSSDSSPGGTSHSADTHSVASTVSHDHASASDHTSAQTTPSVSATVSQEHASPADHTPVQTATSGAGTISNTTPVETGKTMSVANNEEVVEIGKTLHGAGVVGTPTVSSTVSQDHASPADHAPAQTTTNVSDTVSNTAPVDTGKTMSPATNQEVMEIGRTMKGAGVVEAPSPVVTPPMETPPTGGGGGFGGGGGGGGGMGVDVLGHGLPAGLGGERGGMEME